jgi:hypothetical protein
MTATKTRATTPTKARTKTKARGKESTKAASRQFAGGNVSDVLALIRQAKTVELKLTIPDHSYRSTGRALGLDPLDAQLRQVFFFDTPDLALNAAGVVVRARRSQGGPDDTVIKLRPVVPSDLPAELRALPDFGVEVDAMPGGHVCSASYKAKLTKNHVRPASLGQRPISKLFTAGQRDFYAAHAPAGLDLDQLSILGPLNVLKLKHTPDDFGRKLAVELWLYPDGSRVLELSTKCAPNEAFQVAAESQAYLTDKGVDLDGEQATKTATALTFFAAELNAG